MKKRNETKTDIINMSLAEIIQWIEHKPIIKLFIILFLVLFACNTFYELGVHVGEFLHYIING